MILHFSGTGKTHTMEGDLTHPDNYGVIPRSAEYIFQTINHSSYTSRSVVVSCLEIYNEELRDLLGDDDSDQFSSPSKSKMIDIYQGKGGVICKNLKEIKVESANDVLAAMRVAQKHRMVGETKMNLKSSRSHCVFTIRLRTQRKLKDGRLYDIHGKLHLVDLAGSECAKSAALDKGIDGSYRDRGRERSNINKSLLTLGRVILMLNEQCKNSKKQSQSPVRIPYRDSKLTRILQDSLGGHCKTIIIATVSPSTSAIEETMSTLNYAQSASGIINKPIAESFIKGPDSSYSTPVREFGEANGGVDQWYEMEMRMEYLTAQLEEAQAALARHYTEHKEAIERAKKAENELIVTKEKLGKTETDLNKSISILLETKDVIVAQQEEIKQAKVEQKQLKQNFVQQVLSGVTNLVNDQMSIISTQHEDKLSTFEQQNHALNTLTDEARTMADSIFQEINDVGNSVKNHANESRLNEKTMKANSQLTNAAIDNLEALWISQRKMVDHFVVESNEKANSLSNHEEAIAAASSGLQKAGNDTNLFIANNIQNDFNDGMSELGNLSEKKIHHATNSLVLQTDSTLNKVVTDHRKVVSDVAQSTDAIVTTVEEGKENITKVASKQCATADELRDDVESSFRKFNDNEARRRRSKIDFRKEDLISQSTGFTAVSTDLISSSASAASTSKSYAKEYERKTVHSWKASPLSAKKRINYKRSLSSTPDKETILKNFDAMEEP
jgi:hypothetical protein